MVNLLAVMRYVPKRTAVVAGLIVAAFVPTALFAWGPERPTYTIENPAPHVTFNSITNNPVHGDERSFMLVREAGTNDKFQKAVSLQPGKEYEVYLYFHNDAGSNLNASGKGIATGTKVRAEIPAIVNGSTKANGFVSADNAQPKVVWDEVTFDSSSDVALRLVPNSAKIHSKGAVNGATLSDDIVTTGAVVGYDKLDGKVPGCAEYSGYVTFKLKADQADFTVGKMVSKQGENKWQESYTATPGETVDYLLQYKNTGTTIQRDVLVKDMLPTGMTYAAGSAKIGNPANPNGVQTDDGVTGAGLNIGNYNPGQNAWVIFSAKTPAENKLECGSNTLVNIVRVETKNGSKEDGADVVITKDCQTETPEEPEECKPGIPVGDARCKEKPETPVEPETPTTPKEPETPVTPEEPATPVVTEEPEVVEEEDKEEPKVLAAEATELPKTGPGAALSGLFAVSALGLSVHTWFTSRRILRDTSMSR